MTEKKKRISEIDILKGLGMITVLMDHVLINNAFFYPFEVALFFLAAGYCFNRDKITSGKALSSYYIKQIKSLYIPLLLWNSFFILFNNIWLKLHIYSDDQLILFDPNIEKFFALDQHLTFLQMLKQILKVACLMTSSKLGGVSWFIRALIVVLFVYALLTFLLHKKEKSHVIILIISGLLFIIASIILPTVHLASLDGAVYSGTINEASSSILTNVIGEDTISPSTLDIIFRIIFYFFMFSLGQILKDYKFFLKPNVPAIVSSILIILLYGLCRLNDWGNDIFNHFLYAFSGLSAWIIAISIARLIKEFWIGKALKYIGQNTLPIIFMQLLAFKLPMLLELFIYHLSWYYLAAFPSYSQNIFWQIILILSGLLISLGIHYIYKKIKRQKSI